jgi:hypothetical protein
MIWVTQLEAQLMPAAALETRPDPVPASVMRTE